MSEAMCIESTTILRDSDRKALDFIKNITINADQVQVQVLAEILPRNGHAQYLKCFEHNCHTDMESFKNLLPIITYEDLQPGIPGMASGDKIPILSSHLVSEFLTRSRTSVAEGQLVLTIEEELDGRTLIYSLVLLVMNQYKKSLEKRKGMYILFEQSETKTRGEWVARPVLTSYSKEKPYNPYTIKSSPVEAISCLASRQSMYVLLLYDAGLYLYRGVDVLRVSSFHNSALTFHFVGDKNVIFDIDLDKNDRVEWQDAVNKATGHLECYGAREIKYSSYPDISIYVLIFWVTTVSVLFSVFVLFYF